MNALRRFIVLAASVLFITGLVKLVSAGGDARILSLKDQLLSLTHRQVYIGIGLIELLISGYLWFGKSAKLQLTALAWLLTNFAVYRLVLWSGGGSRECGCLGNALDWWPWMMKHQNTIMSCLLGFLITGAYGFLWREWRNSNVGTALPRENTGMRDAI